MENTETVRLFKLSLSTCNIKDFRFYLHPYLKIINDKKIRNDNKNNSFYKLGVISPDMVIAMKRKIQIKINNISIYELSVISNDMIIAMKNEDTIKLKTLSELFLLTFINSNHMTIDIESMFLRSKNDDINAIIKFCDELGNIIIEAKKRYYFKY
jgi:hypothetical protein